MQRNTHRTFKWLYTVIYLPVFIAGLSIVKCRFYFHILSITQLLGTSHWRNKVQKDISTFYYTDTSLGVWCVLEDNHTGESDVWLHSRGRWRVGLHFRWNHWSTGPFWCIVVERSIAQQDGSFPCQLHRTDLMSSDFSEVWNHYTKIQSTNRLPNAC